MSSALFVSVCLASVCLSWAVTPEYKQQFTAAMNDCLKELKVDKNAVIGLTEDYKVPETKEQKCFTGCFMDKMGYVKDMAMDWEKAKASNSQKYEKPELLEKANKVADACAQVVKEKASDLCELSVPVMKCTKEEAQKLQLPIPDIKFEE